MLPKGQEFLVTKDMENVKVLDTFPGDQGNYMLGSLTGIPGKVMEQIILETISKHKCKKVTWNSWFRFTNRILGLTNLITSYNEVTVLGD